MKNVILNASKDPHGKTALLGGKLLNDMDYLIVNLIDYHIDQIGQQSEKDEFFKVIEHISHADHIVFCTPVYWSDMTGYLKTFIDRLTDIMDTPMESDQAPLNNANTYLVITGSSPEDAIPGIENVIKHISRRFYMNYKGMIRNDHEAETVNHLIKKNSDQKSR